MFPVTVSCPNCEASLMDSYHPIEGFPSIHLHVSYKDQQGDLRLSSLYGSYRGKQELEVARGDEVDVVCPHCKKILSNGPMCINCQANTVILDMKKGGSVWFCSRYGCQKHAIAFGDLGKVVVASIMNRYIVTVYKSDSLLTAVETMINYEISGVPVLDDKESLHGVLTEERFLELAYPKMFDSKKINNNIQLKELSDWDRITCGEVAITDHLSIDPEISLTEASTIMFKHHLKLLLVVKKEILVGVLSRGDLCRALLREKIG